jgi:hypothetical protein
MKKELYKIKNGCPYWQDEKHYSESNFGDKVFIFDGDFNGKYKLIANGYGVRYNYGNGAIYVYEVFVEKIS